VRVIGQGDKERIVPLPAAFGQVFGFWLKDPPRGEFVFAKAAGQKPVSSQAARAYLRGMVQKAGIKKRLVPTNCAILTPQTCSMRALNGWTSRRCSGTRASPPPRLTPFFDALITLGKPPALPG
jgi:hypothetical protein